MLDIRQKTLTFCHSERIEEPSVMCEFPADNLLFQLLRFFATLKMTSNVHF